MLSFQTPQFLQIYIRLCGRANAGNMCISLHETTLSIYADTITFSTLQNNLWVRWISFSKWMGRQCIFIYFLMHYDCVWEKVICLKVEKQNKFSDIRIHLVQGVH